MERLEIILPLALLGIAFLLKLLVSQSWKDIPNIIQNICELPVDITFLALSFAVAFTISNSDNHGIGLTYCFIGVGVAILVVAIRKICIDLFFMKRKLWVVLCLINLLISSFAISKSVYLIIDETIKNTELPIQESHQEKASELESVEPKTEKNGH